VKKAVKKEVEAVFFRKVWMEVVIGRGGGMEVGCLCDAVHIGKFNLGMFLAGKKRRRACPNRKDGLPTTDDAEWSGWVVRFPPSYVT
jgi:hypothetical protein